MKGTTFRFAVVSCAKSPREQAIVTKVLASHFKEIYFDVNDLPDGYRQERIIDEEMGFKQFMGYVDGCSLDIETTSSGFMWFRAWYSDYEASLASSARKATVVWILGRWWVVWTSGMMIS